ncbi:MAG TPA: recombinase family protein [Blastocatellia bacterium]|nr:recombinase family protein [Blastocatellia bacterium]
MSINIQAAIYARVSSEQQAAANTIASQLAALRERLAKDGLSSHSELEFIDEGYSGATLVRPALEKLRDLIAFGTIDRLYVHSPDRLARKYAYQVLLVDEFQRAGVEVIFLNRELGASPEDELLLQVQGMMAEYERAKIIERHRRGKRYAAHAGSVNVMSKAPYGYRYVTKDEGEGKARYEIAIEEARVVRQIFDWVGRDRLSIGEVCRRLTQAKELTRTGRTQWDRSALWAMLKNPAYMGMAAFGKKRLGEMRPRLRARRGGDLQPRSPYSLYQVPPEEWISIPVPAIVEPEIFAAVQEQLKANQRHARQRAHGAKYLLQGLICCHNCGYAYYGRAINLKAGKNKERHYAYYRCTGTDAHRFGGERICDNLQVRTDLLDLAVWQEVRGLLENPHRLAEEYHRRLQPQAQAKNHDLAGIESQLNKLRQGTTRIIDSYSEGLIDKQEFEPRIKRLRERIEKLEGQARELSDQAKLQSELHLIIGRLEDFTSRVKDGLDQADWNSRRDIIRALVKRVDVEKGRVNVVFRVDQRPFESSPARGSLQHCRRRTFLVNCQSFAPRRLMSRCGLT